MTTLGDSNPACKEQRTQHNFQLLLSTYSLTSYYYEHFNHLCIAYTVSLGFVSKQIKKCCILHAKIISQGTSWQTQLHHPFSQKMPFFLPCSPPRPGSANPPSTRCSSLAGGQSPLQLAWLVSHGAQWLSELTPVTPPCHHTAALAQNAAITLHIFDGFTISLFAHTFHLDL